METENTDVKKFNSNGTFRPVIVSSEEKFCTVRFPTDKEWCARSKRLQIIRRDLGRGRTQRDVTKPERVDKDLFDVIVKTDDNQLDEYEASKVIQRLGSASVRAVDRIGNSFRITMLVFGGVEVVHELKMPSLKDSTEFGRTSVKETDGRRHTTFSVVLEPSGELWDKLMVSVEGYADGSGIPIVHKDIALVEVLQQCQAIEDEADPEV